MDDPEISADAALEHWQAGSAVFVDVRDPGSFRAAHIPGSLHVNDHNIADFVADGDREALTIVACYHGNSSLGGAAYLRSQGFSRAVSLEGGLAGWGGRPTEESPPLAPPPPRAQAATVPPPRQPESRRTRWIRRIRSLGRGGGRGR